MICFCLLGIYYFFGYGISLSFLFKNLLTCKLRSFLNEISYRRGRRQSRHTKIEFRVILFTAK